MEAELSRNCLVVKQALVAEPFQDRLRVIELEDLSSETDTDRRPN
jgi:hypothetical protein